jgi:hypothetical protein
MFAGRLPAETLESIQLMLEGGEYGELAMELTAALAANHTVITRAERDELLAVLLATNMPTAPAGRLTISPS